MRILKISDVYFPRVNGVSTAIRTFAREFVAQGHHVELIAPAYPQPGPDEPFLQHRLPAHRLPFDPEDRLFKASASRKITRELAAADFDLIHVHTPFRAHYLGLRLGKALGIPVIETYHTYFEEYLGKYIPWLPGSFLRSAARRLSCAQAEAVDALIVPSQPMLDVLRDYGVKRHAEVIPTGLPDDELPEGNGLRFRQRFKIPTERPILLYVGRVAHEKNITFLIEMFTHVHREKPNTLLVIAGEGPARGALQRQANRARLADHVRFIGYLTRGQDLSDCYAAGDAFVFASNTETQGLVLLESMKLGTPVVSTAVMGTATTLADARGGLVAEQNVHHFSQQCLRLLCDHSLRATLAAEAREKAREWRAEVLAQHLLRLYRDVQQQTPDKQTQRIETQKTVI